jgi:hypothetical protein
LHLAYRRYDLRLIQDYLGHRDPKHTVHDTRAAGSRFEGLWCESASKKTSTLDGPQHIEIPSGFRSGVPDRQRSGTWQSVGFVN